MTRRFGARDGERDDWIAAAGSWADGGTTVAAAAVADVASSSRMCA